MQGCEDRIEVPFTAGVQNVELQPEFAGSCLQVFCAGRCEIWTGWVEEQRHRFSRGYDLVQQLQPFLPQLDVQIGNPGDVAAWSRKACDESNLDWIGTHLKDDWNR